MTDLEDLWSSLPTGTPPVSRILARGRRPERRRFGRPVLAVGAAAALGAAFLVGTQVSGSPGGAGSDQPPTAEGPVTAAAASPVAFHADLSPADSCQALLDTYVRRGLGQVTAWGWESQTYGYALRNLFAAYDAGANAPLPTSGALAGHKSVTTDRVTASETGTNVQEQQVDEPDTVKTDGRLLVQLRGHELQTYDVSGSKVRQLSAVRLEGLEDGELLLAGDTVTVVGADDQGPRSEQTGTWQATRVQTVSLEDPSDPRVTDDVSYDGTVTSLRQQGETVRMVLSTGLPDLPFARPGKQLSRKAAEARNRRIVQHTDLHDWLPGYDAGNGSQELLDCADVAVPPAEVGLDTAAVVTFATGSPESPQAFGLAGATTIAYESADHLYLASSPVSPTWGCIDCLIPGGPTNSGPTNSGGTSYLFEFDLEPDRAVHVASGEVEGTIRDRWSLDETGGELRVLVGPSSETGDFNSIVTLHRSGDTLVEDGRLDHLGPREEIKSVRWQDDLAIVVTYRQMDPVYVVDLRHDPRLLSELHVPGFSSYLHPLGSRRLVGVGSGPGPDGWGAQLALFRTRDLAHLTSLDVWHYPRGTEAQAGFDPRAFTWLPEHRSLLTVIRHGRSGWLSIQHLADGALHNRMVHVEYGDDIDQVRTFGMPDGRVVLVTGEDVRFLRLGS